MWMEGINEVIITSITALKRHILVLNTFLISNFVSYHIISIMSSRLSSPNVLCRPIAGINVPLRLAKISLKLVKNHGGEAMNWAKYLALMVGIVRFKGFFTYI